MSELVPAGDVPPLGHLVAALSADGSDVASMTRVLTGALADALPPGMVDVEFERSMSDRMKGRPGTPVAVTVTVGDRVLSLRSGRGGRPEAMVSKAVRGVVLTRTPVGVVEWVTTLAQAIQQLATDDEATRATLHRLLLE